MAQLTAGADLRRRALTGLPGGGQPYSVGLLVDELGMQRWSGEYYHGNDRQSAVKRAERGLASRRQTNSADS